MQVLNSACAEEARIRYDAFGNVAQQTGTFSPRYTFSTKEYLADAKLYLYAYRVYDPVAGRWTQRDPIGYEDSPNLYQFCGNNPVNKTDDLGDASANLAADYWMDVAVNGCGQGGVVGNAKAAGASMMIAFIDFFGARDMENSAVQAGDQAGAGDTKGSMKTVAVMLAVAAIDAAPGGAEGKKVAQETVKHSKLLKKIVTSMSKTGKTISDEKIAQLKRVVKKAGGNLRTEVGNQGSVKGVLHSQTEGLGSRVDRRKNIHANQNQ